MFSLPVPPYQQSARANSTKNRPGKRKRKGYHIREQQKPKDVRATDGYAGSLGSSSPPRHFSYSTVLTPDEIYQYAVAGQAVEVELPSYPFPHAKRDGPSRYDYDLRQQVKSAHASPSERYGPIAIQSLHHQHLAVMTTILHRSLLEEDFVRAGRALGMILRDEVGGRPVDVRAEGRWGIGAEILMRQDAQRQQRGGEQDCSYSKEPHRIWKKPVWFTRKGFEDAKKYYERLIVQYPFFKQNPNAISARDFYPAMFGLWIYVVHREARLESHGSKSVENGARQLQEESVSHVIGQSSRHQPTLKELSQAREIADRMDAVMSGPPYREDSDLIELRRMVRLWIHDLEEELAMPTHEDNVRIECEDTPMQFLTSRVINVSLQSQRQDIAMFSDSHLSAGCNDQRGQLPLILQWTTQSSSFLDIRWECLHALRNLTLPKGFEKIKRYVQAVIPTCNVELQRSNIGPADQKCLRIESFGVAW